MTRARMAEVLVVHDHEAAYVFSKRGTLLVELREEDDKNKLGDLEPGEKVNRVHSSKLRSFVNGDDEEDLF